MSKYIIELDDRIKLVTSVGVTENGVVYTTSDYVHNLEELNSDYINEHYGSLQDEAYRKGFDDGKASIENGCKGCKYEDQHGYDEPCNKCLYAHVSHYTSLPKEDDRIEVGDEVKAPRGKAVVTAVKDDLVHYFYSGGDYGCIELYHVTKTGKHYDIQSILEAMRTHD